MPRKIKRDKVPALYVIGGDKTKLLSINKFHLNKIVPKTGNQSKTFQAYAEGHNLVLSGFPGVGKTFLALFLALSEVLDTSTPYEKVVIVRSTVPTRNQGFLPGSLEEKQMVYELPYKTIIRELIVQSITGDVYEKLKAQKSLEFISTSFVRGITINDAIIVVDEFSNLSMHELDSVFTRIGKNCKIIFSGDTFQSDLLNDKYEHVKFLKILENMKLFRMIEFGIEDILRSDLVKQYIIEKYKLGF